MTGQWGSGTPPFPAPGPGNGGFIGRLGDRALRRAEPRFGVALAGVGVVLVVIGAVAWAGEQATGGDDGSGDSNRLLGILMGALIIAAGYALVLRFRHGALAAAGVVAATLGVPVLMAFVTFDESPESDVLFALPFDIDALVLLSLAGWMASYLATPVTTGRVFFLAASTLVLWLWLLDKVEEGAAYYVVTLPFSAFLVEFNNALGDVAAEEADFTGIGGPSLIIGFAYYVGAFLLDRKGYRGIATPFVAIGFLATVVGIAHLADDLEATGTGVLLILIGAVLTVYGVAHGRRFTAWSWAAGAGLGVVVILTDAFDESVAGFGISTMLVGAAVVVVAHLVADRFGEQDEMEPGPSRFTPRPPRAPVGAWPAGSYPQPVAGAPWGSTTGQVPVVPPTSMPAAPWTPQQRAASQQPSPPPQPGWQPQQSPTWPRQAPQSPPTTGPSTAPMPTVQPPSPAQDRPGPAQPPEPPLPPPPPPPPPPPSS